MIKVKVVGACGYGGVGISELLASHPAARIQALVDVENTGLPFSQVYPHLTGALDAPILAPDDPKAREPADVVFMATPDGVGMSLAAAELDKGARVIDYSGDFRFNSPESYAEYARRIGRDPVHKAPQLLQGAVYGLAELHRRELTPSTRVVGNPGCFAVSCILGLAPAVREGLIETRGIICDCKTGVSGAGKKPAPAFDYPARYDHMNAYKLAGHQHVCEIERELGLLCGGEVRVTFTPQVMPACRGILSCLYGVLRRKLTAAEAVELYRAAYARDPFVRVFDAAAPIGTLHVRTTNRCFLTVSVDERTGLLRVVSHIDNLMKGQAGSALQNMNLIFGLEETAGLARAGIFP